jgi:hypothetical protein
MLFEKLKLGERRAFRSIYNRYVDEMWQYIYFKIGRVRMTEMILVKVFVILWNERETNTSMGLQQRLYSIARTEIIRYFRDYDADDFRRYLRDKGFI